MNQKINLTTHFVNIVTKKNNINSILAESYKLLYFPVSKKSTDFVAIFKMWHYYLHVQLE